MNTVAEAIKSLIGDDALAAVEATNITEFDDIDTPGLQADVRIEDRDYRMLVTLQPSGLYKVYVFDPRTMETKTEVPMVHGESLYAIVGELGE
jgi:hypothetical protein